MIVRDEKLQYDVNKEALLSGKIDKYEYLMDEEILRPNQSYRTKLREKQSTEFLKHKEKSSEWF